MFTKVQAIVPFIFPGRNQKTSPTGQLEIDTDENTITIKCWNRTATHELMEKIRHRELRVVIEEVDS